MRIHSLRLLIAFALIPSVLPADEPVEISFRTQQLSDQFFSESATIGDFNRDGVLDVASGPFWYAGPDFKQKVQFYPGDPFDPHGYSNNFFAFTSDFDGDGWVDILVYGFPGKDASWFENPRGQERFWPRHQVLDIVDNESPTFVDITGDGVAEIVCSSGGYFGFAEINKKEPTAPWTFRKISDQSAGGRFTHGLGVGDVNGDGRMDLLEKSGWWEQPADLTSDPTWRKHPFDFAPGRGSAQMFAYDVDGDGDQDVITSLDAHGYGLAWYEQQKATEPKEEGITFVPHPILGSKPSDNEFGVVFSQLHAVDLADVDGDGLKDIVTGKRWWAHGPKGDAAPNDPAVVYWFKLERPSDPQGSVRWIPHLIDDASGVGTDVCVKDINGDGAVDVIVGNKKGTFVSIQQRRSIDSASQSRVVPRPRTMNARSGADGLPKNEGLAPAEAADAMTVPEGFRVQLAAGEPMVHQPIAMTFDARGRLWVAEAHTYPIRADEGEGQDKIIILEDNDNDGIFDNRHVFIDGLNLVSGLEVGFGGVWVGAAPYLMFIPDADGDDRPDGPPQILLDGFGYQDTHETLNAFIWGPDGWLYGCHGVFTHSNVGKPGTPDEERVKLNCGVWRYHPVRHQFDIFARGTSNPWGLDFNEHGQAFITACVIPHMFHMIQGGRYQRQGGQHFNPYIYEDLQTIADHAHYAGNIRDHAWWGRDQPAEASDTDAAGGGHAHCGAMIYLGDNWPRQYRGSIFMANVHGNRINNDLLRPVGSGYVASHGADLLFANDRWFRAINMKCGPDGSVYIIDWYDKNACHRRDKEIWDRSNGRVYRVSFGGTDLTKLALHDADWDALVDAHTSDNEQHVRMARRLLQERFASGQDSASSEESGRAITGLRELAFGQHSVERRLRAIWTLHAIDRISDADFEVLMNEHAHKSEHLRGWAIRLLLDGRQASAQQLKKLASMATTDPSPVVRLSLASALQQIPLDSRWSIAEGLSTHADDARDPNLPLMIWYGIEPLVVHDISRALSLAKSSRIPKVSQLIYRRAAADSKSIAALLVELGETDNLDRQSTILNEVVAAVSNQGRLEMPAQWPNVYAKLSASKDDNVRRQAQLITVKFGDASIFPVLRKIAVDSAADLSQRQSALDALLAGQDPDAMKTLITLLEDPLLSRKAIRGLASYADRSIAKDLLSRFDKFNVDQRGDAVATLASRTAWANELLDAVERKSVQRQDLSAFAVSQMQLLGDSALSEKINRVWGRMRKSSEERKAHIESWKQRLKPDVIGKADRSHGRLVYDNTCGKCHRLFGSGGQIGPDITGSNRADLDYTLHNILDPNALVGRDYQTTMIVTLDGRVINGLLKESNDSAVTIQTANERLVIDRNDIEEQRLSDTSMMPEGQLDQMKFEEARDLIAYLAGATQVPLPGEGPVYNDGSRRVEGAIEAEALRVVKATSGNAASQKMNNFSAGRWSGDDQLWWTGAKPQATLTLSFPVREAGRYELFVAMTKARDYGVVSFAVNQQPTGPPHDLFHSPEVITTGPVSLGTYELKAGDNELAVSIEGANPKAVKAYMFGLDYLYVSRQ
ncbi:MAG: FG-GAP-like repeat-containing protein [Pirellulaceae bacterium]